MQYSKNRLENRIKKHNVTDITMRKTLADKILHKYLPRKLKANGKE